LFLALLPLVFAAGGGLTYLAVLWHAAPAPPASPTPPPAVASTTPDEGSKAPATPAGKDESPAPSDKGKPPVADQDKGPAPGDKDKGAPPPAGKGPLVVAKDGSGDCTTIGEALSKAKSVPDAVVRVRPGKYEESLTLDRDDLSLEGDGRREDIVVVSAGAPCLTVTASCKSIGGLTLQAGKDAAAVVTGPNARPSFQDCVLSGGRCGLLIRQGADPLCTRCQFDDNEFGVQVDGAKGRLRDCAVNRSKRNGVSIANDGDPSLEGCKVLDGQGSGVVCTDRGRGRLINCTVEKHRWSGVMVAGEGSDLTLTGCKILGSHLHGLEVTDGGRATLQDGCEVAGNALDGVRAENGRVVLKRCAVHNNDGWGVEARKKSAIDARECRLGEWSANRKGGSEHDADCDWSPPGGS
jgi:hypothetical protein